MTSGAPWRKFESVYTLYNRRGEAAEGADVGGAVPGVWVARRRADGLVSLEETRHEELFGQRGQSHAADLAVVDYAGRLVWIDYLYRRPRLGRMVNHCVIVGWVERFVDLIDFDHNSLWARTTKFVAIDLAGLGRAARYASGDKRRKHPDPNLDETVGASMALAAHQIGPDGDFLRSEITAQEIIDQYRGEFDLRPALVTLDNLWLLPNSVEMGDLL